MNNNKLKIGIAGAAGFSGLELIKILVNHPGVEISFVTSERFSGKKVSDFLPREGRGVDLEFEPLDAERQRESVDAVFLALPAGPSLQCAGTFAEKCVVIDLSAAFRIKDKETYQKWYKEEHTDDYWRTESVYGLVELYREQIKKAQLIANPGCYPTSALLPLQPLAAAGAVKSGTIIVDSKSGVSGMGRKVTAAATFMEIYRNFRAYGVGTHRHTPEISQEVQNAGGSNYVVVFTPHLVPIDRGIESTIYFHSDKSPEECRRILKEQYRNEPFIYITDDILPETIKVSGTNLCWFTVQPSSQDGVLIIVSVIDNLVKGAAGQAVQNFNVRFGFDEQTALV